MQPISYNLNDDRDGCGNKDEGDATDNLLP